MKTYMRDVPSTVSFYFPWKLSGGKTPKYWRTVNLITDLGSDLGSLLVRVPPASRTNRNVYNSIVDNGVHTSSYLFNRG